MQLISTKEVIGAVKHKMLRRFSDPKTKKQTKTCPKSAFSDDFRLLLNCQALQRDFRQFLIAENRPELTLYVDFPAKCHRLRALADCPVELQAEVLNIHYTHLRTRANDKLILEDFGLVKKKVELKIVQEKYDFDIFDEAVALCAQKIAYALDIYMMSRRCYGSLSEPL